MELATTLAGIGILLGLVGIVLPLWPGLILVLASVLGWALVASRPLAWGVLAACAAIACLGWALQYLIPGRGLKRAGVPNRTLLAGAVVGVVGIVVVPGIGLLLGFVAGVILAELARQRSFAAAWPSARRALIAAATSFGIELVAGMLIAMTWSFGAWHVLS